MKKICTDIGELRKAISSFREDCPINPVTIECKSTKQRGIFSHTHVVIKEEQNET
jgi:hypothetical protein